MNPYIIPSIILTIVIIILIYEFFIKKAAYEKAIADYKEKNSKLFEEKFELIIKLFQIKFIKENPSKYDVTDEVKEGLILEKRINEELIVYEIIFKTYKNSFWEYRVFNKTNKSEKWVPESLLNPKEPTNEAKQVHPGSKKLKKYFFKKIISVFCVEWCRVRKNGIKIGSFSCQECKYNKGYGKDAKNNGWIKCSRLNEAIGKTTDK